MSVSTFPPPVGGIPLKIDFAPSIVFAVAHGLLVPLLLYRIHKRSSRTLLIIGTMSFNIERIILFGLRASQAHRSNNPISKGLINYAQSTFGVGYISMVLDLVKIIRVLIVNATYGSKTYDQSPAAMTYSKDTDDEGADPRAPPSDTPDHPKFRFRVRRLCDCLGLGLLVALVVGIVVYSNFYSVVEDHSKTSYINTLRYLSGSIALFGIVCLALAVLWAQNCLPRVNQAAARVSLILVLLLCVVANYRLGVMSTMTTSLLSTGPGSLNRKKDKVLFYILQALPEWLVSFILASTNVRQTFGTGLKGDYRAKDETEEEREKKLKEQQGESPEP